MARHSWEELSKFKKRCRKCGMIKLAIPHPYERLWITQWSLGDKTWSTIDGHKTPPCDEKAAV